LNALLFVGLRTDVESAQADSRNLLAGYFQESGRSCHQDQTDNSRRQAIKVIACTVRTR
jgi:hypothetical protein